MSLTAHQSAATATMAAAVTTLRDTTLADAGGEAYARWLRCTHRVRTRTVTAFDIPGLDEALAVSGLPREHRRLMETLQAGMSSSSDGERDAEGNRRLELRMDATPERPASRLVVVEHAGAAFWSHDGTQFGELGSARPAAETEAALELVDDLLLESVEVDQAGDGDIALEARLTPAQAGIIVDARRILGPDAATSTVVATVTVHAGPERCERRLRAVISAATDLAGDVSLTSETVEERTDLDHPGLGVEAPRLSMSLPRRESVDAALRLGTPRGASATKRTRKARSGKRR
jgi:hypothetical protein